MSPLWTGRHHFFCDSDQSFTHAFMQFYFAQLQLQKTQYLQLGQNRGQYYGGSLPNVNQIGNGNIDLPFQVSPWPVKQWFVLNKCTLSKLLVILLDTSAVSTQNMPIQNGIMAWLLILLFAYFSRTSYPILFTLDTG